MKRTLGLLVALLAAPLAAQGEDGRAEEYDVRSFTCPLGGEPFTQDVGYLTLPLETLPDGSWLGDVGIVTQIPECPGNGLVILPDFAAMEASGEQGMLYSDYAPTELARLPALIADPEYAAARADGRYALAYWLATRLERPPFERFVLLQRATWGALAPELRRKLVAKFVAEAPMLIEASDLTGGQKRFYTGYVANGLRELGRFDEALALLDRLEAEGGAVQAAADPGDLYTTELGPALRRAIAGNDDGRFPVEMLSPRLVGLFCGGQAVPPYDQRSAATDAACRTRREREAREAAEEEAAFEESYALREDPAALDRLCGETPAEARGRGLQMACETQQRERDVSEGDELARHGATLAPMCEATPENAREGPLFFACLSYGIALESALQQALEADDEGYAILCGGDGSRELPDRNRHVTAACSAAHQSRLDAAVAALLANPAALAPRCAVAAEDTDDIPLAVACSTRERERMDARIELLVADDREYRRQCARFGGKPNDAFAADPSEDEIACDQALYRREEPDGVALDWAADETSEAEEVVELALEYLATGAEADPSTSSETRRMDPFAEGSELRIAARAAAEAIVVRARAEGTYSRRQPGDLY